MAEMNFGGVIEKVVTSQEFSLEKAREIMKDEVIAVLGYGVQGPGQACNLRDNGFNVIVGQREGSTYDKAVADGIIYRVVTTNLTYQTPELLARDYYISCDMSKYIAYIIDTLNHDCSISDLLNPYERIQNLVKKYKAEHGE